VIDVATKQCHCSPSAEGPCADFGGGEACCLHVGGGGGSELICDVFGLDCNESVVAAAGGQRFVLGCVVLSVVQHAPCGGGDGAAERMPTATVGDDFSPHAVLLSGEGAAAGSSSLQFGCCCCAVIESPFA